MIPNPYATDELMPQTLNSPQRRSCGAVHVSAGKLHVATRSVQLVFVRSTEPHPIKSPSAKNEAIIVIAAFFLSVEVILSSVFFDVLYIT
jgi:hypothetical protein